LSVVPATARNPALTISVMARLFPAINVLDSLERDKDVDAFDKRGHDDRMANGECHRLRSRLPRNNIHRGKTQNKKGPGSHRGP
ncbi:MAG TPA: hypothetical protein VN130_03810, partial [Xanthobacteraceae bacterium]|nr:hypothetical protein [Xanthobacteraceae bacterium]